MALNWLPFIRQTWLNKIWFRNANILSITSAVGVRTQFHIQQYMKCTAWLRQTVLNFPNIEIALRIYLTMMPTNCTGERSFSKLKIVKNHLRSCMLQPWHFFSCNEYWIGYTWKHWFLWHCSQLCRKQVTQEIILVGNKFSILLVKHVECR